MPNTAERRRRRLRTAALAVAVTLSSVASTGAQSRRIEPAEVECPSVLGVGVDTDRTYCDVQIGDEIADGVIVRIPPHRGPATVTFTLHGRHTYSEDEVARGRGYARYLATAAVASAQEVLARPVVLAEFHGAADLVDRVGGGAGPGGVKAIAPVGAERIRVIVPSNVTEVSVVGLELEVRRVDSEETQIARGRAIALISDVNVEYRAR
ncbi:MAG: hypothetical protein OXG35_16000 [Acidobacteria bacterium]|nr:hypothetical protein [Acidobacteriota bacterium]